MKFSLIKIVKYLLLPFGILYQAVKREKNEILVLMYHRVNDRVGKELSVKEKNFRRQMDYLKKKNYRLLSMDDAAELMKNKKIQGKYIVLTFDDGYEDFYTASWPVLRQYGYPSTVYIVPGYIETSRVFPWDQDLGETRLMSWGQIQELNKTGTVDFGSHTHTHFDLDIPESNRVEYELRASKQQIEKKLGREIRHFAYPKGLSSPSCEQLVQQIYATGALIFDGDVVTNALAPESMARLKRIPVQRSDGYYLFIARIKGWLVLEKPIRKIISKH